MYIYPTIDLYFVDRLFHIICAFTLRHFPYAHKFHWFRDCVLICVCVCVCVRCLYKSNIYYYRNNGRNYFTSAVIAAYSTALSASWNWLLLGVPRINTYHRKVLQSATKKLSYVNRIEISSSVPDWRKKKHFFRYTFMFPVRTVLPKLCNFFWDMCSTHSIIRRKERQYTYEHLLRSCALAQQLIPMKRTEVAPSTLWWQWKEIIKELKAEIKIKRNTTDKWLNKKLDRLEHVQAYCELICLSECVCCSVCWCFKFQ